MINLLGVKQIAVGVNEMDCDTAGCKQSRFDEIASEIKNMLVKVGWKKEFVEQFVEEIRQYGLVEWTGNRAM